MANDEKQKFYHPCAVIRSILERLPEALNAEHRSVLQTLLLHLKTSGIPDETAKCDIVVRGQASLVQLELSGYREASIKRKLNHLRQLGHVDWEYRDDNRGRDFFVYATAQDEVKAKAIVDPARSEQGRRAAASRKDRQKCQLSQRPDGQHEWEAIDEAGTQQCFYCLEHRRMRSSRVPEHCTSGFIVEATSGQVTGFDLSEEI